MGDVIQTLGEVLIAAIMSEKMFFLLATVIMVLMGLSLWFLIVINTNRNIAYKRKNCGMAQVKQTVVNIKKIMVSRYYTLAKDNLGEDYFNEMETSIARYMYTLGLEEREDRFRTRIHENGFEHKTAEQWRKYVSEAIKEDFEAISAYMDDHYHPHAKILRPVLYKWNEPILKDIQRELEDLLEYLLRLACDNRFKKFFGKELHFGTY